MIFINIIRFLMVQFSVKSDLLAKLFMTTEKHVALFQMTANEFLDKLAPGKPIPELYGKRSVYSS